MKEVQQQGEIHRLRWLHMYSQSVLRPHFGQPHLQGLRGSPRIRLITSTLITVYEDGTELMGSQRKSLLKAKCPTLPPAFEESLTFTNYEALA